MSKIKFVQSTPTITSGSAYATGNVIGGVMTFSGLADRGFSTILSIVIADASGQNVACDLFLFNQAPSAQTDKTAVALSSADLKNCVGVVSSVASDWASGGTGSICGKSGKLNLFIGAGGSVDNNLYAVLVARGAATYTSTSAITVGISADVPIDG